MHEKKLPFLIKTMYIKIVRNRQNSALFDQKVSLLLNCSTISEERCYSMNAVAIWGLATFFSIIACWSVTWFGFIFWGCERRGVQLKLLLLSALQSLMAYSSALLAGPQYALIVSVGGFYICFFLLFRHIPLQARISTALLSGLLHFFAGGLIFIVFVYKSLFSFLLIPMIGGVIAFSLYLKRRNKYPGRQILQHIDKMHKQNLAYFILLVLLQFATVLMFILCVTSFLQYDNRMISVILIAVSSSVGLAILYYSIRSISLYKEEAIKETQDHYIEDVYSIFSSIRGQRHDFIRHAQTILNYVELNDFDRLHAYSHELIGEMSQTNEMQQIGHPAFSALIQAKTAVALNRRIDFQYEFTDLECIDLSVKSIDLVKMLGNLLDNAFDEVSKHQEEENRWVEAGGWLHDRTFFITVRNPGGPLNEEDIKRMFTAGYTTKKNGHSGLGLSIVKERIEFYKGTIRVESNKEDGILFKLAIPVTKKKAAV